MDLFKEYGMTKAEVLTDIERSVKALLKNDECVLGARLDNVKMLIEKLLEDYEK